MLDHNGFVRQALCIGCKHIFFAEHVKHFGLGKADGAGKRAEHAAAYGQHPVDGLFIAGYRQPFQRYAEQQYQQNV